METAFVYGTAHQFILTTEVLLLKSVRYVQPTEKGVGLNLLCFCVVRPSLCPLPAEPGAKGKK